MNIRVHEMAKTSLEKKYFNYTVEFKTKVFPFFLLLHRLFLTATTISTTSSML